MPSDGLGTDRAIPVLPALRGLLPYQGLVRGSTVAIGAGVGATSVLFGLLAEATKQGSWAALVGLPGLGLSAAANTGVVLERLALVPEPGPQLLGVVASLLDGFDIVAVCCPGGVAASVSSQLSARARKAGSVLVAMSEWPSPHVTLSPRRSHWLSRGRLRCRQLTVSARGRGGFSRPVEEQIWLPDDPAFRTSATAPSAPMEQTADTGSVRRLRAVS